MPKTGDLVRELLRAGFVLVKHGTRHDTYEQPQSKRRVQVPRHYSVDIGIGLYHKIRKDAGLR